MDSIQKRKTKKEREMRERNGGRQYTEFKLSLMNNIIMPYSLDDNYCPRYNMIALTWVEFTWTFLSFGSSAQLALQAE